MQNKKSVSQPIRGMNRDTNISQLKPDSYILGININSSSEVGDSFVVTNEPSNTLAVQFPTTYKVIGFKKDILKERTYYFLTSDIMNENSPHYKRSSIGYVEDTVFENFNEDIGCTECENTLETPLENIVQVPSNNYVELVHDRCIPTIEVEDKGFNFDINSPLKKIDIKQEKLGTNLYWEDWRNPSRYLQVTRIEESATFDYLHTLDISCQDPQETPCLNVDKLLVFPKHRRFRIEAKEEQIGGNLKKGSYEFWGAYCDLYGNEITEYCTPTNPISIWDENNNILEQTDLDSFTNSAIKLKIHNLDIENFKYYKIAVVERNNVANAQSVFLAGIYPTTDDTVLYTHSGSNNDDLYITRGNVSIKKRMDFNQLTLVKPTFERARGSMISDNRRFIYGLETKEELNLQPVVNLFSQLVKAQTSVASEKLYKSSIATSKYKQYTRNEVQPLAIRFLNKGGSYSANFPFIGRPKLEGDGETVEVNNNNRLSLEGATDSCSTSTRTEKWQIYNTAEKVEDGFCFDLEANSVRLPDEVVEKVITCPIETPIGAGEVTIELEEEYYNLEDYVNKYADSFCEGTPTNPHFNAQLCSVVDASQYENVECIPIPVCGEEGSIEIVGEAVINIKEVVGETSAFTYKEESEYTRVIAPKNCNPYLRTSDGGYERDYTEDGVEPKGFENLYIQPICICNGTEVLGYCTGTWEERRYENVQVFLRDIDTSNETCTGAEDVAIITNPSQSFSSISMGYAGSLVLDDLKNENINISSTPHVIENFRFYSNVHNRARFYKIEKNNRNEVVFEISKYSAIKVKDFFGVLNCKYVRCTIFNRCGNTPTVYTSWVVDLTQGSLVKLDVSNYSSTFYIAIDSPISNFNFNADDCSDSLSSYMVVPPPSCFGIYQRNIEPKLVTVGWTSISLEKKVTYNETCPAYLPQVNDCDPVPFEKFRMAYWESTVEYPDNKELWDSSNLQIKPRHLENLNPVDKEDFLRYFTTKQVDISGHYVHKDIGNTNKKVTSFYCEPIRHPKFPDNTVAPYITDNINHKKGADSIIFPMGINFDSKLVQAMLEVALDNKLLTKKQKDDIYGWEILRGDNTTHKSVTSSGILFDVNEYTTKNNDKIGFSNFPFNDLGNNKFITGEDGTLVPHKYSGEKNNQFTYMSPDMFLTNPTIPSELSLQGYLLGSANSSFHDVKNHAKWSVLGSRAYNVADSLATAEVALEITLAIAQGTKEITVGWTSINIGGAIAAGVIAIAYGIQSYVKYGEYRYQWLKTFRDLGNTYNYASFQVGEGKHNRLLKAGQFDDNYLRRLSIRKYLKDDLYTFIDETSGEIVKLNHDKREHSIFLKLGNTATGQSLFLEYPDLYKTYDNNTNNSRSSNFTASDVKCVDNVVHRRDIGNPYVQLKNYIPDQWDNIDSIKWLTTNYIFDVSEDTTCKTIYGGTQVISRFSWRVKVPLFRDNAIKIADKLPYLYSRNSNLAKTRFYCDYETSEDSIFEGFGTIFPDIVSSYNFDCTTGNREFFLRPPSKFYLYTHGVVDFLVESEINCNFRYSRTQPEDQFYRGQSLGDWLQEVNFPIVKPNTFYYNNTYTFPVSNTPHKKLDRVYSKEVWNKRRFYNNAWIWSEKDNNENSLTDPWLIYKPLNFYEDKSNKGELIDLKSIESDQFFGRYEDQLQLFNQVSNVADAINGQNKELGTGFLYARPIDFKKSDLGFAGTQNTEFVSTPYGHYFTDAKRGRIFRVDQNGGNLEAISETIGGQPSNMKQWFREHLPFKILKQFPQVDVDNKFKGLGLNMWYDDRNSRVFITKRDYKVINPTCLEYDHEIGFHEVCQGVVQTCPPGYVYSSETGRCEYRFNVEGVCPTGYTYNQAEGRCVLIETLPAICICEANVTAQAQTICSGSATSITLISTFPGTSFNWTVVQAGVTGASNGSGNIISQTLNGAGTATYTVTPYETVSGCLGTPVVVVVTVNQVPTVIATPNSLNIESGDSVTINLTSNIVGTTFTWTALNNQVSGATSGSGNTITDTITGSGSASYTITPTNNGCVGIPIIVVVTSAGVIIDSATQINIWFDNSGSMNSTLAPLTIMRDTILKPCLLPAYNNNVTLYNSRVNVQYFATPNDASLPGFERYIRLLATTSTAPGVTKVINLAFADESDNYELGNAAPLDIQFLRGTLSTALPNSLFGVIFQVVTLDSDGTIAFPGFRTFVDRVHTSTAPFTGTNGLVDRPEITHQLDVVAGSTPQYYANLIVTALNNLGFNLTPC
jgi:hypothetical protein